MKIAPFRRYLARCYRQRAGIDCRHVAAHRGLAGNEAADRLSDAGRRRWMVPERAAAFISCASSIPLLGLCPPAVTGRRVDLADQLHQTGISIVGIQETRCRRQVTGLSRGFGVFAAAADQAGHCGVEQWIRQDIMGDPRSFDLLVAEPRFLLVKSHTAAGVI